MTDFLCRTSDQGPHFLHVHDEPSYHADVMRHAEMGWEMKWNYCQATGVPHSSGDPGVKPFQVLDLTASAPNTPDGRYRDDHHVLLGQLGGAHNRKFLAEVAREWNLIPVSDLGMESFDLQRVRDQINSEMRMGAEFLGFGDYVDSFVKHRPKPIMGHRSELSHIYQDERGDL